MMGPAHRASSVAFWLGGVLAVNTAATLSGYGVPVNPVVAAAGVPVVAKFAAGKRWSPDADLGWLWFLGHRGATHSPVTVTALTVVTGAVWWLVLSRVPAGVGLLAFGPVAGWWGHIAGDRLWLAVGLRTDGTVERVGAVATFRALGAVAAVAVAGEWLWAVAA